MLLLCLFQHSMPVPGALPLDVLLNIPHEFQTEAAEEGSPRLPIFLPPFVWKKPWQNRRGSNDLELVNVWDAIFKARGTLNRGGPTQ